VFSWVPGFAGFVAATTGIGAPPVPTPTPTPAPSPSPAPGGSGGPAPGGGVITPPRDTVAPRLAGVKLSPRTLKAKRAAKLTFSLSEAAAVTVTVLKPNGKPVAPAAPLAASAGRTTRKFSGKKLRPGRYKLRIAAVDTAGNAARTVTVAFRVGR
jgi:hypothetical protein